MARGFRAARLLDRSGEPAPRLIENHHEPQPWTATWLEPPFQPDLDQIDQAYGVKGGNIPSASHAARA